MARVPIVGNDLNNWGDVLNEFLTVSHAASGTNGGKLNTVALSGTDFTGTISLSGASIVSLPTNTYIGNVAPTEISYLDGISSNIQTQLNNKSNLGHIHTLIEGAVDVTATSSEISQALSGIGTSVTSSNLTELTDGSQTVLHTHLNTMQTFITLTADSTGNGGLYSSISAPNSQTIYVGYANSTGDIKSATSLDSGTTWSISTIDVNGNGHSAITSPTSGTIYASYYNDSNYLAFAKSVDNGTTWSTSTVDSTGGNVGQYTSIHASDTLTIAIGYYDVTNSNFKIAKSSNGGLSWETVTIDSSGDVGKYSSIKCNGSIEYATYYDTTNGDLKLCILDGVGAYITTVDSTGDVGQYSSLSMFGTSNLFISYYDVTNGNLKFAKSINSGSTFTVTTIDSTGDVGKYSSIKAIDANNIIISYYDETNGDLKIAQSINGGTSWTISTIDSNGLVGQYTSIDALDATNIFISYYDITNTNLKFSKSITEIVSYAKLNTSNTWTKAQNVLQYDLGTVSGSANTDASLSNTFIMTASGNITLMNPTNLISGGTYIWNVNQDGVGGRTIMFDTLFKFPGGTVPTLSTTAGAKDTLTSIYDGTILRCNLEKDFK